MSLCVENCKRRFANDDILKSDCVRSCGEARPQMWRTARNLRSADPSACVEDCDRLYPDDDLERRVCEDHCKKARALLAARAGRLSTTRVSVVAAEPGIVHLVPILAVGAIAASLLFLYLNRKHL